MFSFDGITKDYIVAIEKQESHFGENRNLDLIDVAGRRGAVLGSIKTDAKEFTITFVIKGSSRQNLRKIADDMIAWLTTDTTRKLVLPEDPDRYYDAILAAPLDKEDIMRYARVTATFISPDGLGYSNTTFKNTAISDAVSVVNEGTAPTDFTLEATAYKNSTMFMVSKGEDDYFMLGRPTDAFKDEADTTPAVWRPRGNNIQTFTRVTDGTWIGDRNLTGQYANGTLSSSGSASFSGNYGEQDFTSNGWYGPVYRKSLDNLVGDFHTRSGFTLHQTNGYGVGKAFVHLYDEGGNKVLSYGLIDATNRGSNVRAVVRLYDENGGYEEIYNSTGYRYNNVYADRYIWISVDRVGNKWQMKTWHNYTENGIKKVTARADIMYTDGEGLFDRKIAFAEIALGKHARYPEAQTRLSWAIIEDKLELENVVPHLIKEGDTIIIDTKQSLVLLNDEPVTEHKDFGSNYFTIGSGLENLLIEPQGRFDTTVKWNDVYL